jgi:hypothetical protein
MWRKILKNFVKVLGNKQDFFREVHNAFVPFFHLAKRKGRRKTGSSRPVFTWSQTRVTWAAPFSAERGPTDSGHDRRPSHGYTWSTHRAARLTHSQSTPGTGAEPPYGATTPQSRSWNPAPLARLASALDHSVHHPRETGAVNGRHNGKRYPCGGERKIAAAPGSPLLPPDHTTVASACKSIPRLEFLLRASSGWGSGL